MGRMVCTEPQYLYKGALYLLWSISETRFHILVPEINQISRAKGKKVKQSHYRPEHALRVPGGWSSQISRQSAHECGKVVSPTHRPRLSPRKYSWYSFILEPESTPRATLRPEGLYQWKIPITPTEIEPATFRLVAQCLNQLSHRVPLNIISCDNHYAFLHSTHLNTSFVLLKIQITIPTAVKCLTHTLVRSIVSLKTRSRMSLSWLYDKTREWVASNAIFPQPTKFRENRSPGSTVKTRRHKHTCRQQWHLISLPTYGTEVG